MSTYISIFYFTNKICDKVNNTLKLRMTIYYDYQPEKEMGKCRKRSLVAIFKPRKFYLNTPKASDVAYFCTRENLT